MTYGGTYHTATISIDGRCCPLDTAPIRLYGDCYLETGWQWLEDNGYVPRRDEKRPHFAMAGSGEELGIKLQYYATDVKRQRDL
jgi:hypothetical protein